MSAILVSSLGPIPSWGRPNRLARSTEEKPERTCSESHFHIRQGPPPQWLPLWHRRRKSGGV